MPKLNDCEGCPHLGFCETMDITPLDCESLDIGDFNFEKNALNVLKSFIEDEEWETTESKYTDDLLDYGDDVEDE